MGTSKLTPDNGLDRKIHFTDNVTDEGIVHPDFIPEGEHPEDGAGTVALLFFCIIALTVLATASCLIYFK